MIESIGNDQRKQRQERNTPIQRVFVSFENSYFRNASYHRPTRGGVATLWKTLEHKDDVFICLANINAIAIHGKDASILTQAERLRIFERASQ